MKQIVLATALLWAGISCAAIRIPAGTAYLAPDVNGARVSSNTGITGWTDPQLKVLWFGEFNTNASPDVALDLRLPGRSV
jgi:hypothetical protein